MTEDRTKPNPQWRNAEEGEDCGGGCRWNHDTKKFDWFRIVCRGGKPVEEPWEGPKE